LRTVFCQELRIAQDFAAQASELRKIFAVLNFLQTADLSVCLWKSGPFQSYKDNELTQTVLTLFGAEEAAPT
jgi:hypothetical protein